MKEREKKLAQKQAEKERERQKALEAKQAEKNKQKRQVQFNSNCIYAVNLSLVNFIDTSIILHVPW